MLAHYYAAADDDTPTPPPDDPDIIIEILEHLEDHYSHSAVAVMS